MTDKEIRITELLKNANHAIESNHFSLIPSYVQTILQEHPDWLDERLQAELGMIEKQMEYKMQLKDWEYFRVMKLVYRYCEQQYATEEVLGKSDARISTDELPDKDVIWWCWLQGLEQAPAIVQACYQSLKKLNRKIVVLTSENIGDYISFPDWIEEAREKGILDRTHYSDLVRLELLTTRGGTWIDATVFCTDAAVISDVLEHDPLFCYSFLMRDSVSDCMMFDNWFLHCTKPSKILMETKQMLYAYWKREKVLHHYFLFHLMFSIACRRNPKEMEQIPLYSNEPVHMLQTELLKPYSERRWKQICGMSGIHKLTYKYDEKAEIKGTMLEHILETIHSL